MTGESRTLGSSHLSVLPIGLGCMSLSGAYGAAVDSESEDLIRKAADALKVSEGRHFRGKLVLKVR